MPYSDTTMSSFWFFILKTKVADAMVLPLNKERLFDLLRFRPTILASFRRKNLFEPHFYAHNKLATLLKCVN